MLAQLKGDHALSGRSDEYAPVIGNIGSVDKDLIIDLAADVPVGFGLPAPGMGPVPG